MIVRVPTVYMSANDKGVVAFEKPLCKLYAASSGVTSPGRNDCLT